MLPGGWAGERAADVWLGPPSVRLHPIGQSYSVIRSWSDNDQRFRGWYVNLEQPWVRTAIGFDSRDDVLDVTASDDLSSYALKDEDELGFAVEVGTVAASEAAVIRATAERAVDDMRKRRWPFREEAWESLQPSTIEAAVALPSGWDRFDPTVAAG